MYNTLYSSDQSCCIVVKASYLLLMDSFIFILPCQGVKCSEEKSPAVKQVPLQAPLMWKHHKAQYTLLRN